MKIKQVPEDFVVEEIIDLHAEKKGDQTYFWLIKKNWTTEKAIREIAGRLYGFGGISYRRFKFAGNKDRVAVTRQAVSGFKVYPEYLRKLQLKDIRLEIIGFGDTPISLGSLKGNRFTITIRDLTKKELAKIKKNIPGIKKGFRNYFGAQRFGLGNTHLIGKEIIRGYFEQAVKVMLWHFKTSNDNNERKKFRTFAKKNWGKWDELLEKLPKELYLEKSVLQWLARNPTDFAGALRTLPKHIRKLYVHAYQSWLWNSALRKVKSIKKAPVPGYDTKLGKDKFSKEILLLLKKDKLTLESFICGRMPELAVKGEMRLALVKPKRLLLGKAEADELNPKKLKLKLSFELPKGTYATTLIEELA